MRKIIAAGLVALALTGTMGACGGSQGASQETQKICKQLNFTDTAKDRADRERCEQEMEDQR